MMLMSFEEIELKSHYKLVLSNQQTFIGTKSELSSQAYDTETESFDLANWEEQPKELQLFYKSYEYAVYTLRRTDLLVVKKFYEEYLKNPDQFNPEFSRVISTLSKELDSLEDSSYLMLINHDGLTSGRYHVGNFREAIQTLDIDFNIIKIESNDRNNTTILTTQETDTTKFKVLRFVVHDKSITHDKEVGDGKYYED